MRRMNAAFFTMNGVISIVFFAFVAASLCWPHAHTGRLDATLAAHAIRPRSD
jgi:hypothetical protein